VAAHPHYPEPRWGTRLLPYCEVRAGIDVLRLPLWGGRASAAERYRQELTFMAAQTAATPFLARPDVLVSTSPSFPALLPAVMNVAGRRSQPGVAGEPLFVLEAFRRARERIRARPPRALSLRGSCRSSPPVPVSRGTRPAPAAGRSRRRAARAAAPMTVAGITTVHTNTI
jgi:hypothetical protein